MNQTRNCLARFIAGLGCVAILSVSVQAADPWADGIVSYAAGTGAPAAFTNPAAALGKPTLFTDPTGMFGGVVTPFNTSFGVGETVSLGAGGSLVVKFDEPVTDDPRNPFGIDLLVFGNAFLIVDFSGPEPIAQGVAGEGGQIAVSADGVTFFDVVGEADGKFPTNAYIDVDGPFTTTPGAIESDFTRPVDPAFDVAGKTLAQLIAGYGGSGGGAGIDIAPTGMSSISYVRISNPSGAAFTPEIDALADVTASIPEPASRQMFFLAAIILLGKSVRTSNVNAAT
jgi:hypothetical protein